MNTPKNLDQLNRGLAHTTSRRQALKMVGGGLLGGAMAGAGFAVAKDTAAQPRAAGTAVLQGTNTTVSGLAATLDQAGNIVITGVTSTGGTLNGVLQLTGQTAQSSCDILYLDLLGLVVEITAVPGAGNLLGNLLCAVAGLLDSNAAGNALVNLLNRIFGLLG